MNQRTHFRATKRHPARMRVELRETLASSLSFTAKLRDLSMRGALVETERQFAVGERVVLRLTPPTAWEPRDVVCEVRWLKTQGAPGFGVAFVEMDPQTLEALYDLLGLLAFGALEPAGRPSSIPPPPSSPR